MLFTTAWRSRFFAISPLVVLIHVSFSFSIFSPSPAQSMFFRLMTMIRALFRPSYCLFLGIMGFSTFPKNFCGLMV
jgi:hypothetical protein